MLPIHNEEQSALRSSRATFLTKSDESTELRPVKSALVGEFTSVADCPSRNGNGEVNQTSDDIDHTDISDELNRVQSVGKGSTSSWCSDKVDSTKLIAHRCNRAVGEVSSADDDIAATTEARFEKQENTIEETSPIQADCNHSPQRRSYKGRQDCIDYPGIVRNHVDQKCSLSEKTLESNENSGRKNLENTPKSKNKKLLKRMSLRRFRKKKTQTELIDLTPSPEEKSRRASVLSGSLECLIDAVSQEESPPPLSGEFGRSISLCDLSVELDDREANYLSDTSASLTSEMSLQSEYRTSSESLQRVKFDEAIVVRRAKYPSIPGLPSQEEHLHIDGQPPDSKKLEHRHSLKDVSEEKPVTHRRSHHTRNKSDTLMLPSFQHSYMYTVTSPRYNPSSSQNILQSLHDHIKSMPNVFRRDRANKPVISELRAIQMTSSSDPIDLLIQYQFLSLRCCIGIQGHPKIRKVLQEGKHNTEAQNYKLSFEREPNN